MNAASEPDHQTELKTARRWSNRDLAHSADRSRRACLRWRGCRCPTGTNLTRCGLVHTGQDYDPQMSDVFFTEFGLRRPDFSLEVGSASHA
jgi:hypothetical protein